MRIYLAGPMRGYQAYNHPAFDRAAIALRTARHEVFSPAEQDRVRFPNRQWNTYMGDPKLDGLTESDLRGFIRNDVLKIIDWAEALAFLPGWERSEGAAVEWALGKFLKLKFIYL